MLNQLNLQPASADFSLGLLLDPEDGSDSFFRDTQRYNPEDLLNPDF
jgi:hypothetical protein